ncbi:unnamed protein product [Urochloa decumbens]|uniref:Uncharacterized protein n=1 Tax=Urochloa decumbens TaxID=240449 RepID=A0ABC9EQZ7_9POAL
MVSFEMSDRKKIGLGLTGFGVLFSFLGIIMLFDKGFLAMGNILFVSGVLLTIGLKPTVQFFTKPKNHKGSISFGFGFFLVLIGWPALGMMVESYGFIMLFSGFWPTAAVYLQKSPSFGWIFHHPFVTSVRSSCTTKKLKSVSCAFPLVLFFPSLVFTACSNFVADHSVQGETGSGVIRLAAGSSPKHVKSPVQK